MLGRYCQQSLICRSGYSHGINRPLAFCLRFRPSCPPILHLDDSGLSKTLFGIKLQHFSWTDIAEVGVAGTRVFNQNNPKRAGSLYLYFSPKALSEEERFDLMLRWPPSKSTPYMIFDKQRLTAVQLLWGKKIEKYNAGDALF